MHKQSREHNSLFDKITAFVLMISVSIGTRKGRAAVSRMIMLADKTNKLIRIGFRVILIIVVFSLIFFLKKWLFSY